MNVSEERIHRCLDNDLKDDEMQALFREMSANQNLRTAFTSALQLRDDVREALVMDQGRANTDMFRGTPHLKYDTSKSSLRWIGTKKIKMSVPSFIVLFVATFLIAFYSLRSFTAQPKSEYVYVMQLPQVVVHDTY
jgi:hypothetical protein